MRLIDADALKYKNLAEVNERLTYVLTPEEINNAPTVDFVSPTINANIPEETKQKLIEELQKTHNVVLLESDEYPFYQEAYQTGYEEGRKDACKNRSSDKWYDHVENSLLKARHGKHVLYDVDYLLDHLAHEVSIMEQVRQMRDKEI